MQPLQLDPARAKTRDPSKLWYHPMWKLEHKLNGWRFLMHFGRDLERTYLTGRRVSDRTGVYSEKGLLVPQLWVTAGLPLISVDASPYVAAEQITTLSVEQRPNCAYTVLDGEVMPPPGCGFRDLASFLNTDYQTAQMTITKWGPPTYHVFDVLFVDGIDVRERPMLRRRELLQGLVATQVRNPLVRLVDQLEPLRSHYETEVACGGEGVVLKRIDGAYGESGAWVKVKRCSTLDVIVTGFTAGKGKYLGQVGAIRVSVRSSSGELLEVAQVSGMDDATRRHATDHPGDWLGVVVEIEAQEWGRDRLLHPRFVRRRPDAQASDCTFVKMTADLRQVVEEKVVVAATSREQTELKL